MNLFEKIFNYQIITRLDESGSYALSSQERAWLKALLAHPSAGEAFSNDTLKKLGMLLQAEVGADVRETIIEKGKNKERQVHHPLLPILRRTIMDDKGVLLSIRTKHGTLKNDWHGLPYKLEYNMVKREWYLLWYNPRNRSLMSTKLQNIVSIDQKELPPDLVASYKERIGQQLERRQGRAVVQVVKTYNAELSRILYAFSCFDKTVEYDEADELYHIRLFYQTDESEYLLSKIRFLGLRVKVVEGDYLIRRMRETAGMALARYGV